MFDDGRTALKRLFDFTLPMFRKLFSCSFRMFKTLDIAEIIDYQKIEQINFL
jgi:hypothetical protein